MDGHADELDRIRRTLYSRPPEQFQQARTQAEQATTDHDLRAAVHALRKHTRAAWIVNAYVAEHPEAVDELRALGQSLAAAQAALDAGRLRELTTERRQTVRRHTAAALARNGSATAALRDEVLATLDAATADARIADELGALQRARRWSGFGTVPTGLAAVPEHPAAGPAPSAHDNLQDDVRHEAAAALIEAEAELARTRAAEDDLRARVRRLTTRMTTLQNDLADAREQLTRAQADTAHAQRAFRTARSAADRSR